MNATITTTAAVSPEIESEIRDCFKRLGEVMRADNHLSAQGFLVNKWGAYSQYGFLLKDGFETQEEAEAYVLEHYSTRMNLIRQ